MIKSPSSQLFFITNKNPMNIKLDIISDERRGNPLKNEDQATFKANNEFCLLGVFDGATAIGHIPYFEKLGKSPGRVAAEIAKVCVENNQSSADPVEVIMDINRKLRLKANKIPDITQKSELFTTMGFVARIDRQNRTLSYAAVGDCACIVLRASGTFEWFTDEAAITFDRKEIEVAQAVSEKKGVAMSHILDTEEVKAIIATHRRLENDPKGKSFGTLKGSPDADMIRYMRTGKLTLNQGDKVFIVSDGMFISPIRSPKETRIIENSLKKGGLRNLLTCIRKIQDNDATLGQFPRLKQYDDATGIEIEVID